MEASNLKANTSSERKKPLLRKTLGDLGAAPRGHMLSTMSLRQAASLSQRNAKAAVVGFLMSGKLGTLISWKKVFPR